MTVRHSSCFSRSTEWMLLREVLSLGKWLSTLACLTMRALDHTMVETGVSSPNVMVGTMQ